tara:strand:+ start:62424 stop:63632 length:1209 start_codon:yes stop_codon:yes gene_type:complete
MKWYNYFNKKGEENLIESETITEENLMICQQLRYRRYTLFKNFNQFTKYFFTQLDEEKCFYEMMREKDGRKPYFDIDIDDLSFDFKSMIEQIKNRIIDMIGKKIKIIVFDSSTETKLSFHIIVDDVYLQSYKELLTFYDKVDEKLSEENKKYMDRCVYKSVQQFRIVQSHKFMKNNIKRLREDLSYRFSVPKRIKTEIGKFNYLLASSLVTNVSACRVLCGFQPVVEEKDLNFSGSANEGDIEDVMKMFYKKYSYGDFTFQECKEKNGNLLIVLRRLNPTYCDICKRIHESENPFITVTGDFRNVVFYCRRTDEKDSREGDNLGCLGVPDYTDISALPPPVIEDMDKKEEKVVKEVEIDSLYTEDLEQTLEDLSFEVKPIYKKKRKPSASKASDTINWNCLY